MKNKSSYTAVTQVTQTEDQLQAQCYQWAFNTYPTIRGLLFSIPNGGHRNQIEAMKMKATGLTPGIPDMVLISPIIAFEFKTAIGKLSPAQEKIHSRWETAGVRVEIIRDFETFKKIICSCFITTN